MNRTKVMLFSLVVAMLLAAVSIAPSLAQGDTLLIWADGERAPLLQELGEEYTEETGVEIEIREIPLSDARDELLNFGEAGEGPDLMITPHDNIGQLVENGAILPIEMPPDLEELFSESSLNLFTYQEQLWALPYGVENIALVRNVELVPDVPATWQEVTEISNELRENGDAEFGFLVQTGDAYHNFPITSAFGGYIFGFNDDGTYNPADVGLNSEGGLAAGEWLESMYAEGLMVPNVTDDVLFELFTDGELGMFMTGPWNSQRIIDTGVDYEISEFPGAENGMETGAPFSGGQGFVISAFTENPLLAQEFLFNFIATDDVMEELYVGRIPVFEGVEYDDPNFDAFIAAGANSIPMPVIPEMNNVWTAAGDALTLISQGGNSEEALNTAVEQIDNSIELSASGAVASVSVPGAFNSEIGCDEDWLPGCEAAFLEDQGDGIWTNTFSIPAGEYEFKVAINGDWAENYGVDGEQDGANIVLTLEEDADVTFTYDRATNVVTTEIVE